MESSSSVALDGARRAPQWRAASCSRAVSLRRLTAIGLHGLRCDVMPFSADNRRDLVFRQPDTRGASDLVLGGLDAELAAMLFGATAT